jgi:tRNA nucleotidyltransferase/poly(A) polymerase
MTVKKRRNRRSMMTDAAPARGSAEVLSQVCRLLEKKRAHGYVVGGFLRDMLLGESPTDLDLAVEGVDPAEVASHIHERLGFSRPVVFPRFRTALTVGNEVEVEVSSLQGSLEEDAEGRDFTLNCLYAEIGALVRAGGASEIVDPTGKGLPDLRRGLLRTPVDPCLTLWLDPIRVLRAFRLRAVHGFSLDRALRAAIPRLVYLVGRVAQERVRTELETILLSDRVVSSFRGMQGLGVCEIVLPELSRTFGFDQATPYHAYDLFTHTLKTTANTPADITLRLAALLHDLGKPAARSIKGRRAVYYGHEEISTSLAEGVLRRLKFPRRIRDRVLFLVGHHMIHYSGTWSDKAVRRFVRKMGADLDSMLLLAEADQRAQVIGPRAETAARDLRERIDALRGADRIHLEPPIDGHGIMSVLHIEEGPLVGMAKNRLLEEASVRDRPMSRREAVEVLKRWAKSRKLP